MILQQYDQLSLFQVEEPPLVQPDQAEKWLRRAGELLKELRDVQSAAHVSGYRVVLGGLAIDGEPVDEGGTFVRAWRLEDGKAVEVLR